MKKTGLFLPALLVILIALAACSSNKKVVEPVEVPPTPLELAREAADNGAAAFTSEDYTGALAAFAEAKEYYLQAAPTATAADSVEVNVERIELNQALTYMTMAKESVELGLHADALEEYEQAVRVYQALVPLTITALERDSYVNILNRNLAITAENAAQYERALGYYDRVLEVEPGNEEILNIKYHILKDKIKDEERAFQVLKDYAEASKDYRAYLILAQAYRENNDQEAAAANYEKALLLANNADVFTRVADFYREIGNYQKSNEVLEKFVTTGPDNAALALAYRVIAGNYDKLRNITKKIEYYDKSLTVERNADVALILANHYNQQKLWDRVISYATQVINLDATKAAAFLLRGNAYYMNKRYSEAKLDLNRIVNDPTYGKSAQDILSRIK
ncbi:MAG TPA: hypothetical protein PKH19_02265 [Candidatus Syntrophosphaera sp.]|nr:hypothetical protein [Candidatus Syntrophosphaera sp.]